MKGSEQYDSTIREMINRESDLFDRRSSTFITIQGIILSAVAFAWDKSGALPFMMILCLSGLGSSIALMSTIIGAIKATFRLEKWWSENKSENYNGPGVIGLPSENWGIGRPIWPQYAIMIFFVLSWCAVAVLYYYHQIDINSTADVAPKSIK